MISIKKIQKTQIRPNKLAWNLKTEIPKTYNIQILKQKNWDLGMIFKANNLVELEKAIKLQLNNSRFFAFFLF